MFYRADQRPTKIIIIALILLDTRNIAEVLKAQMKSDQFISHTWRHCISVNTISPFMWLFSFLHGWLYHRIAHSILYMFDVNELRSIPLPAQFLPSLTPGTEYPLNRIPLDNAHNHYPLPPRAGYALREPPPSVLIQTLFCLIPTSQLNMF